jgi:hypothetical protein
MTGEQARDPEAVLLDEPTTADLRSKVTEAWREFARALAALLPTLTAGAILELTLDPTASGTGDAIYSVTVQAAEGGELVALAVGNASLPEGYRMDRATVAELVALGWSPPGVVPGSGDSFGLHTTSAQATQLAATIARTLRDIYGAPHPAFLVYLVHDERGGTVPAEPLGTARPGAGIDAEAQASALGLSAADPARTGAAGSAPVGTAGSAGAAAGSAGAAAGSGRAVAGLAGAAARSGRAEAGENGTGGDGGAFLDEQVRTVVATMLRTDPDQLQVDSDGDISIRAGSAMVFVRVRDNPPLVDVISPVLTEVKPTEQLYVKLSELTNRMPIGRLYCANETVWASIPVFGRNFQATHLMLAIQVMTGLADELDDRLHGQFGGRRFFGEGDRPSPKAPESERTGMYL